MAQAMVASSRGKSASRVSPAVVKIRSASSRVMTPIALPRPLAPVRTNLFGEDVTKMSRKSSGRQSDQVESEVQLPQRRPTIGQGAACEQQSLPLNRRDRLQS